MKALTIPVNVSHDILVALNETEQGLQSRFQSGIAVMLFQEGKLTIGKAIQLSGLTRYEFEKLLAQNNITAPHQNADEVLQDLEKFNDL